MQGLPLSIIIPSYCGARRLPQVLKAVMEQVVPDDEVIVVDDASSDNTIEIAQKWGARVVALETNGGVGRARNEGAKAARHAVLQFFDDDLVPEQGYLAKLRQIFQDESVACAQGPHHQEPLGDSPDIWQRADALIWHHYMASQCVRGERATVFYSGSFAIRREVFHSLGGFDESFPDAGGEEFEFSLRLCARHAIAFSGALCTRHHFKKFLPRLRNLYHRSQHYPAVSRKKSGEKLPVLAGEAVRLVLASGTAPLLALVPLAGVSVSLPLAWLAAYLMADLPLYLNLLRWKRFRLAPVILSYRHIQYWTIGAGIAKRMLSK
jgi:glycosyltransferase involved in cell wall biosynthesis